jgi:hypothetical protein
VGSTVGSVAPPSPAPSPGVPGATPLDQLVGLLPLTPGR